MSLYENIKVIHTKKLNITNLKNIVIVRSLLTFTQVIIKSRNSNYVTY